MCHCGTCKFGGGSVKIKETHFTLLPRIKLRVKCKSFQRIRHISSVFLTEFSCARTSWRDCGASDSKNKEKERESSAFSFVFLFFFGKPKHVAINCTKFKSK